jgi:hypothetical protein
VGGEAGVVAGAELGGGDVAGRGQDSVAYLLGSLDRRAERVGDGDEDADTQAVARSAAGLLPTAGLHSR